jgi:hypothetical protein
MIKKKAFTILLAMTLVCLSATLVTASNSHRHRARYAHHHHHGKVHKVLAVAAPIGIGAAFGPAGSIGYQGFKHRRWIKRHLTRHHEIERSRSRHYRAQS